MKFAVMFKHNPVTLKKFLPFKKMSAVTFKVAGGYSRMRASLQLLDHRFSRKQIPTRRLFVSLTSDLLVTSEKERERKNSFGQRDWLIEAKMLSIFSRKWFFLELKTLFCSQIHWGRSNTNEYISWLKCVLWSKTQNETAFVCFFQWHF